MSTDFSDDTTTLPGGALQENDIVVALLACHEQINVVAGDFGIKSSGYTDIVLKGSGSPGVQLAYKRMGASPDSSIDTYQLQSDDGVLLLATYRGVDTTTAIDAAVQQATGASGDPNAPSYTTVTDGAVRILVGVLDADQDVLTAPAGFGNLLTEFAFLAPTGCAAGMVDKTEATAGALDPAAFGSAGDDAWWAAHFALRPAAAAAAGGHINMLLLGVG
jgi:hypothetical protein